MANTREVLVIGAGHVARGSAPVRSSIPGEGNEGSDA
jgi:hypothetical protein